MLKPFFDDAKWLSSQLLLPEGCSFPGVPFRGAVGQGPLGWPSVSYTCDKRSGVQLAHFRGLNVTKISRNVRVFGLTGTIKWCSGGTLTMALGIWKAG